MMNPKRDYITARYLPSSRISSAKDQPTEAMVCGIPLFMRSFGRLLWHSYFWDLDLLPVFGAWTGVKHLSDHLAHDLGRAPGQLLASAARRSDGSSLMVCFVTLKRHVVGKCHITGVHLGAPSGVAPPQNLHSSTWRGLPPCIPSQSDVFRIIGPELPS